MIRHYHSRTRHFPNAYARSSGYLDWESQPDPFRRFVDAPRVALPRLPVGVTPRYEPAFVEGGVAPPAAVDLAALAQLLQDAVGLSAWKEAGTARWALRMNPSSGNLHPTETYLVTGALPGLAAAPGRAAAPGVWHYAVDAHALELRRALPEWDRLAPDLPAGAVLVGFTSIPWRESWKYGERAFRYCQLDLGHAVAALAVAAAGLGWQVRWLEGVTDADIAALLGVDAQSGPEAECPEAICAVWPAGVPFPSEQQRYLRLPEPAGRLLGTPNQLSPAHVEWSVIDGAVEATERTARPDASWWDGPRPRNAALTVGDSPLSLRQIIHQRRSAVAMDGHTGISAPAFFQVLVKCVAGTGQVPFATLPWAPRVHLLCFVHRVAGLEPGIYLLVRDLGRAEAVQRQLQAAMQADLEWAPVPGAPVGLPLWRLRAGDCRALARSVCCDQEIAGDGVAAFAMLADYDRTLTEFGPWTWRRLHAEAGAVGHTLYLEAEATGIRGTGIGCFFDEAVHAVVGLKDERWRCLYGFTIGGAVEDPRIRTLPP